LDDVWSSVPVDRAVDRRAHSFAGAHAGGPGVRVLDVGCGDGRLAKRLADGGARVAGADPSRIAVERARRAVPGGVFEQVGAAGRLPFDDGRFDSVSCVNVLQHVGDTQLLLSEIRRVLRAGGVLAVAVPNHGRVQRTLIDLLAFERHHDPLQPVVRFYSRRSLAGLLDAFDFEAVEVHPAGVVPLFRRLLLGLARKPALGA
jgi:SAM-dependent methyltransferase